MFKRQNPQNLVMSAGGGNEDGVQFASWWGRGL